MNASDVLGAIQFEKNGVGYGPAYACSAVSGSPCTFSEIMQLSAGDAISLVNASGGNEDDAGSSLMILQVGRDRLSEGGLVDACQLY